MALLLVFWGWYRMTRLLLRPLMTPRHEMPFAIVDCERETSNVTLEEWSNTHPSHCLTGLDDARCCLSSSICHLHATLCLGNMLSTELSEAEAACGDCAGHRDEEEEVAEVHGKCFVVRCYITGPVRDLYSKRGHDRRTRIPYIAMHRE